MMQEKLALDIQSNQENYPLNFNESRQKPYTPSTLLAKKEQQYADKNVYGENYDYFLKKSSVQSDRLESLAHLIGIKQNSLESMQDSVAYELQPIEE